MRPGPPTFFASSNRSCFRTGITAQHLNFLLTKEIVDSCGRAQPRVKIGCSRGFEPRDANPESAYLVAFNKHWLGALKLLRTDDYPKIAVPKWPIERTSRKNPAGCPSVQTFPLSLRVMLGAPSFATQARAGVARAWAQSQRVGDNYSPILTGPSSPYQ